MIAYNNINVRNHIICITESWLSSEILESEIAIPGFQIVRLDRNRHGGGVLIYVLQTFTVTQLPTHPLLELVTITLHCIFV